MICPHCKKEIRDAPINLIERLENLRKGWRNHPKVYKKRSKSINK